MKKLIFLFGLLASVSAIATNAQSVISGSATVSGSAQAGTAQPGAIVYPLPPSPYPYPQDNDIVQFNNLTIENVSSPIPPAEIIAGYDYYEIAPMQGANAKSPEVQSQGSATAGITTKCFRYSDANAKATAIACPAPGTASASGTTRTQLQGNPVSGNAAPSIVRMYPQPAAYRIEVDVNTHLRLRDGSPATLGDFVAGDQINAYGIYNSDVSVQALIVRNLSKPIERQFIQLNNVEVVSVSPGMTNSVLANLVVIQKPIYPCYGFGAQGAGAAIRFPCPLGLKSFSENPSSANVKPPAAFYPFVDSARKYVVRVDEQTILMNRARKSINLSDIQAGDKLNVYGSTTGNGETIDADIVRDLTQPATAANLSGTVTQVNGDGSFVIRTEDGSTYTVQNLIQVGATIKLKGLLDELQKVITQVSEITIRNNSQTMLPQPAPSMSCTSDTDCPATYACEAIEGQGTATACSTYNPNCQSTSTFKIIKGVCRLKAGGKCNSDGECQSGLLCHAGACTNPIGSECSGAGDTSCPSGYQCVQSCGPPVARIGDQPPPYYCELNEYAAKPRMCPICLASNALIDTPSGKVNVKDLKVGMTVFTSDKNGGKAEAPIVQLSKTPAPAWHRVIHLTLQDGRTLWASGNHPTADGRRLNQLKIGDVLDGSPVIGLETVPYLDSATYDLLPQGETGNYWANGILVGSTLK